MKCTLCGMDLIAEDEDVTKGVIVMSCPKKVTDGDVAHTSYPVFVKSLIRKLAQAESSLIANSYFAWFIENNFSGPAEKTWVMLFDFLFRHPDYLAKRSWDFIMAYGTCFKAFAWDRIDKEEKAAYLDFALSR